MRPTAIAIAALALVTCGVLAADPVRADSEPGSACVPEPASTDSRAVIDYAVYVVVFWDPDLTRCVP